MLHKAQASWNERNTVVLDKGLANFIKRGYNKQYHISGEEASVSEFSREPAVGASRKRKKPFHFGAAGESRRAAAFILPLRGRGASRRICPCSEDAGKAGGFAAGQFGWQRGRTFVPYRWGGSFFIFCGGRSRNQNSAKNLPCCL